MKHFIAFVLPAEPSFVESLEKNMGGRTFKKRSLYIRIPPECIENPDFNEHAWGLKSCLQELRSDGKSLSGNIDFVNSLSPGGYALADSALKNLTSLVRIPETGLMSKGGYNSMDIVVSICISKNTLFFLAMATDVCKHCGTMKSHYMDSRCFSLYSGISYIEPQVKLIHAKRADLGGNIDSYCFDLRAQTIAHKLIYETRNDKTLEYITSGACGIVFMDYLRQRVFVARDLFGQIPLYYSVFDFQGKGVSAAFASNQLTLKKTLVAPGALCDSAALSWKDHIDPQGVDQFLAYNYLPSTTTFFKGIKALRGGESIEFRADPETGFMFSGKAESKHVIRYFHSLPKYKKMDGETKFDPIKEGNALAAELPRAAERVLKAYQCIGCSIKEKSSGVCSGILLSGGVDSSFVALSLKRALEKSATPPRISAAISLDFRNNLFSESDKFTYVADCLDLFLIRKTVSHTSLDLLPLIHTKLGWPAADASFMGLYISGRSAENMGYNALFTGDGGDELFGGYLRHDTIRDGISIDEYLPRLELFTKKEREDLYNNDLKDELDNSIEDLHIMREWVEKGRAYVEDERDLACFLDLVTLLPGNNCPKTSVMLNLSRVTPVSPMLDKKWADMAMSTAVRGRFDKGLSKSVLRKYLRTGFSNAISDAPKKMLTLPVGEWYSNELRRRLIKFSETELLIENSFIKKGSFKKVALNHFKKGETRKLRALLAFENFMCLLENGEGIKW